jgi:CDGSH-type Zn-finger protein
MSDVRIKIRVNGPYLVSGPITLVDAEGNAFPADPRGNVALCRCGASATKPFCDGTHGKIEFRSEAKAPPTNSD